MRRILAVLGAVLLLGAALCPAAAAEKPKTGQGPVWVMDLADTVNPGTAQFVENGIAKGNQADACIIVIRVDTPGGVVDSMRAMVRAVMDSKAPVAVLVAPSGARATSAGAFIVLAGHVAAMAPATHLGAASPVGAGGKDIAGTMGKKVKSDLAALMKSIAKQRKRNVDLAVKMVTEAESLDAGQAVKDGLVDFIAQDLGGLLKAVEGKVVLTSGGQWLISSKGRAIHFHQAGVRDKLLSALANPNFAYILLMIGMAGLYFELSHPGTIFPGVVGALSLILAFFAMSALPVSYAGLALIGLAVVLFIAEIKITSYGMLSLGGAVSLILGSVMLFESEGELMAVSLSVLAPVAAATIGFFTGVAFLAGRAQLSKKQTGMEGLIGQQGVVFDQRRIKVMGEIWRAHGLEGMQSGDSVEVVKSRGLEVFVKPVAKKKP